MATNYDSSILQQYADDLYSQAKGIVLWTTLRYGAAVFLIALVAVAAIGSQTRMDPSSARILIGILTFVGILAGLDAGRRRAFSLKLQAQELLCQRQIELNTHRG